MSTPKSRPPASKFSQMPVRRRSRPRPRRRVICASASRRPKGSGYRPKASTRAARGESPRRCDVQNHFARRCTARNLITRHGGRRRRVSPRWSPRARSTRPRSASSPRPTTSCQPRFVPVIYRRHEERGDAVLLRRGGALSSCSRSPIPRRASPVRNMSRASPWPWNAHAPAAKRRRRRQGPSNAHWPKQRLIHAQNS